MDALDTIPCKMLHFTFSELSVSDAHVLKYPKDAPEPICEVIVDGEHVLLTGASDNLLAPRWDCNLSFTAKEKSVVWICISDAAAKVIKPDGELSTGQRVAYVGVLARDLCSSSGRIQLPLPTTRQKRVSCFISIALTVESHDVLQPAPSPQLIVPADMNWEDYLWDETDAAWKRISEWLSYRGYDVCLEWIPPNGLYTPPRPRLSGAGAVDPFQPRYDEEFVSQAGGDPKYGGHWLNFAMVHNAYDSNNRLVVVKLVPVGGHSNEIDVMRFLNSPELRPHRANRCLPVLDVLETGIEFNVLVIPCWDRGFAEVFVWQVDDYFETAIQAFEGLAFMHEHRVFHRDISSRNITNNHFGDWDATPIPYPTITTYDYTIGFFDFELAARFPASTPMRDCTSDHYRGTQGYMAPEVSSCKDEPKSYELGPADVHALGATLLRFLQREPDLYRFSHEPVKYEGVYAWRVVTELVPGYVRLLQEATATDPASRPDASEMTRRLRALREAVPEQLRLSPPEGYTDYNALMGCAIQAHLI